MFEKCHVCHKIVWPWQRKVKSLDKGQIAHEKCKPNGFHGVTAEGRVISG